MLDQWKIFIHQDVSLHQATAAKIRWAQNSVTMEETCCIDNNSMPNINLDTPSNAAFEDSDIIDLLLTTGTSLPAP